jgi:carbonic anhydrase
MSACNGIEKGHITELLAKIKPAIHAETSTEEERDGNNLSFVKHVTKLNVANTLSEIYRRSPILRNMIDANEIAMAGTVYDVHSGIVHYNNYAKELRQLDPEGNEQLAATLDKLLKDAKIT